MKFLSFIRSCANEVDVALPKTDGKNLKIKRIKIKRLGLFLRLVWLALVPGGFLQKWFFGVRYKVRACYYEAGKLQEIVVFYNSVSKVDNYIRLASSINELIVFDVYDRHKQKLVVYKSNYSLWQKRKQLAREQKKK